MLRAASIALAISVFTAAGCSSSSTADTTDTGNVDDASIGDVATDAGADAAPTDTASPVDAGPAAITVLDNVRIVSDSAKPNFQKATATLTLPAGTFAQATLVLDLSSTCFPFSNWSSDKPPSGQYWPADCDAFDRNFETLLGDPSAPTGTPRIELVRAITPFGGPEHIEEDVTDILNGLQAMDGATPKPRTFEVDIPTWSDGAGKVSGSAGGWNVTAKLLLTTGAAPRHVVGVVPIIDGNFGSDAKWPSNPFTLPAGTTKARVDYRATGHGGANDPSSDCGGPAEEFCKRTHHAAFDGTKQPDFEPWRSDCSKLCQWTTGDATFPFGGASAGYCKENPCGDPSSVRAFRANWCPGHETAPISWTPAQLSTAGAHTFDFSVDGIFAGGTWRVSAVAIAYGG
jgi:hypothetical protein